MAKAAVAVFEAVDEERRAGKSQVET